MGRPRTWFRSKHYPRHKYELSLIAWGLLGRMGKSILPPLSTTKHLQLLLFVRTTFTWARRCIMTFHFTDSSFLDQCVCHSSFFFSCCYIYPRQVFPFLWKSRALRSWSHTGILTCAHKFFHVMQGWSNRFVAKPRRYLHRDYHLFCLRNKHLRCTVCLCKRSCLTCFISVNFH